MADFYLKKGDRLPTIRATLEDENGTAVNLSTASSVTFRMRKVHGGSLKVSAAATVTDAAAGQVEYAWAAADVDTAGEFYAEWLVTYVSGKTQVVPNSSHLTISIKERLS